MWRNADEEMLMRAVRKRFPPHCRCDYCIKPYKRDKRASIMEALLLLRKTGDIFFDLLDTYPHSL